MSSSAETARSLLFVPGNRPERFAKAAASGAHAVILDLEDAVPADQKGQARAAIAQWLPSSPVPAVVRINAADTSWFEEDAAMLARVGDVAVMLPKSERIPLERLHQVLPGHALIALVETVRGYVELFDVAGARGVIRIAFGSVDFSVDSGIADEADAMLAVRTQIVIASRFAALAAPIDGVCVSLDDEHAMARDATRARQLGYGAKLCIHPKQVSPINAAFRPSESRVAWARAIVDAFEMSGGAATRVEGVMIDKPVVEQARRILAELG